MKALDTQTLAGLGDPEAPISAVPENGDFIVNEPAALQEFRESSAHEQSVASLRLLWECRLFLGRIGGVGLLLSTLIAFLIPSRYQSVARLMPPDNQSGSGIAMAAAALSGGASGMGSMASELLGLKSTADLLVGILNSRTVEDRLIQRFDLRKVYGHRRMEDTRKDLAARTDISIDRKSQIITINVTDKSPQRAAAMGQAYVEELNRTVAEVSTSSARRERLFLEERLQSVNQDLEAAEKEFSQFASKNTAIDIKEQGKAMVDAAALLQGQYIAARSELEGLRQLYTDSNVRVRSVQARVDELQNQLMKVGGKDDNTALTQGDSLYPSIRKLPLLGVTYADLYRKTRVEEALFETLTKEYELAKVEEAKEIPTVKVLDPPDLPEKKSFPPRSLFMLMGTVLALSWGVTWVFGSTMWKRVDPTDPGVVLAQEVFVTIKGAMPWTSRNGSRLHADRGRTGQTPEPADGHKAADK